MNKFNVGEIVKVINNGAVYSTYKGFVKRNLYDRVDDYIDGDIPNILDEVEIIFIGKHESMDRTLYIIQRLTDNQIYIIEGFGLAHLTETLKNNFMEIYEQITIDMMETCKRKNADYGSSVQDTYERFGDISYLVRITDKYNRILSLMDKEAEIKGEGIEDSIMDMANYLLLWLASRKMDNK